MTEKRASYLASLHDHERAVWTAAYVHAFEGAWKGGHALDIAAEALERTDRVVEGLRAALDDEEDAMRRRGHAPILDLDRTFISGCTCGWKTPPGSTDSDDTFALHYACVRALEKP